MTANVTITRGAAESTCCCSPASAITFARAAANTSAGGFLTRTQLLNTLTQGRQMLTTLEQQNSQVSQDSPTTAWVVERSNNSGVVKPVVLGLTNGTVYEVLAGLNANDSVVIGEQNGSYQCQLQLQHNQRHRHWPWLRWWRGRRLRRGWLWRWWNRRRRAGGRGGNGG